MSETEPTVLTVTLDMVISPPSGITVVSVNHSTISFARDGHVVVEVAYNVAHPEPRPDA